jgi:hypothetical protein
MPMTVSVADVGIVDALVRVFLAGLFDRVLTETFN